MIDLRFGRLALIAASVVSCSGAAFGQTTGADVIVGDLPDVTNNPAGSIFDSVAVGTTSCNKGNTPLNWFTGGTDNRHPAISQNVYRYTPSTGRFEQLGQGQLKHGFTALQGSICNSYFGFGCTSTAGTTLGVGCSDPYGSGLNNVVGSGGPKWQVNAATGLFPYPPTVPANAGPPQVRLSDLNAGVAAGSRFFIEGQYICGDDAGQGNKNNNASWREITFTANVGTVPAATDFTASLTSGQVVHREQSGIYAWQVIDPTVTITTYDVPGDGRFILACKVSGTGPYTYEYALYNMNSHRCAGSFIVPMPGTQAAVTGAGFHDVDVVGEPNSPADQTNPASNDWNISGTSAAAPYISWAGQSYNGTPPVYNLSGTPYMLAASGGFIPGTGNDHTANVLRWGTMFNFRFTSEVAPGAGSVAVGLWRPGTSSYFTMNVATPGGSTVGNLSGACCASNACTLVSQTACTTSGGTWGLPGSSCTPNPCVSGSCCLSGVCTSTLLTACTGTWTSGAACSPNPCPIPTGACCSNNTCAVAQAPSCTGAGMTYQGDGTVCGSVSCPQGNDGCASAVALCDGVPSNGTNVGATVDGTATCASSSGSPDVWYSYIPATAGNVVVDTCTGSYDTAIAVRTGNCPGTTEVACDDDSCGSLKSRVTVAMAAGTRYLIRVSGFSGATGTFSVKVTGGGGQGCNPTGSCCVASGDCTTGAQSVCTSGTFTAGGTCSPNICPQPSGACCTGTACASSTQAACSGAWQGAATACGAAGNPTTCCPANYNLTGGVGVQDIFDFLNGFFAADPRADFNHVNGINVQDIFDFLAAWFVGC
jgi:hypothetical protein